MDYRDLAEELSTEPTAAIAFDLLQACDWLGSFADLHPFSQVLMHYWVAGRLPTSEFTRLFHWPNSTYLEMTECIVSMAQNTVI